MIGAVSARAALFVTVPSQTPRGSAVRSATCHTGLVQTRLLRSRNRHTFQSVSFRSANRRTVLTCAAIDPIDTKGDAPGKAAVERPSHAEESRTLVELAKTCFLATASAELDGHPFGSMVDLACDEQGRPIFVISTLSGHTKDLAKDMRCSVTVQQPTFEGIQDGRVTVVGNVTKVKEDEVAATKEIFMKKHPEAFWAEFADFSVWRMDTILKVRYVGGFGRAGSVSAEAYSAALPDPVAAFTPMIAGHMNADHKDAIMAMLDHYGSLKVDDAQIVYLDKLGMDIMVTQGEESWKQRLPFVEPALDRKSVKDVMVTMTKTAAKAAAANKAEE